MGESVEQSRLAEDRERKANWRRWGPYLSERAWGTVREDYSADGDAWDYFPHDHARSRAYRWSEDGIGGFCDEDQRLCLAVAFWNEHDAILKERMFGLTNGEGNHGEDVKEYYFYLDGTPTHSYMRMLYKYPQAAFPYEELVEVNGKRGQTEPEFELFDALKETFEEDRYFDIFIEYAKASDEDLLCRLSVHNRGPDAAPIHVLPHLWYRNTWTWEKDGERPVIRAVGPGKATTWNGAIGDRWWAMRTSDGQTAELLFTENESNYERLDRAANAGPYVKDGIHEAIVEGHRECVQAQQGSKLAGHVRAVVQPGGVFSVSVRLSDADKVDPFADFDQIFAARIAEADEFYREVQPKSLSDDRRLIQRQAFAGLLWSKQFYHYDVFRWLVGDPTEPTPPAERWHGRNSRWKELHNADVLLMPDAWEYPWFAAWDLAFHCLTMARIDPEFAKGQLLKLGLERFQHASGQYPAYEWNFDDVNPPVIGWAAWRIYRLERDRTGAGDLEFLKAVFQNETLCFSFWVNRKDASGRDIFGGGFLGMDNIGCFDRDKSLPDGEILEQSDGTSWMAQHCMAMLSMSLELARHDPIYENAACKYFEHFLYIAHAMTNMDGEGIPLWDAEDQFYYDVVHSTDGTNLPLKIHSMVGLISLFAVTTFRTERIESLDAFVRSVLWFLERRPDLTKEVAVGFAPSASGDRLVSILTKERLVAVLRRMLDSNGFLSDHGVRSLSRYHLDHPYVFDAGGQTMVVKYLPAESDNRMFGGNSNWRGPIWFPVNYLIVQSLREYYLHYGDDLKAECPTGSGNFKNLNDVALDLIDRLARIFERDPASGRRPVFGGNERFQTDPHWRDYIPFHEYFQGDDGAGLGASHQTGWTALIAALFCEYEEWK